MKKLYILTLLLISFFSSIAQTYENSWINYGQPYYKIKIVQEGIYRLYYDQFLQNSVPIEITKASKVQLFNNGIEQYIYVYDQNNNDTIDASTDFIEFYGTKNDGSFDTQMYDDTNWQANKRYSLINDTAVYFLTWLSPSSTFNGKRLTVETDTNYSAYTASSYFIKESYLEGNNIYYNIGEFSDNADYTNAEGWVDGVGSNNPSLYNGNPSKSISLSTQNIYTGSGAPGINVNTTIVGANNNQHQIQITSTSTSAINTLEIFSGYQVKRYSYSISGYTASALDILYQLIPIGVDRVAFVNAALTYPHNSNLSDLSAPFVAMYIPDGAGSKAYYSFTNFNSSSAVLYDVSNHRRITVTQNGTALQALIPNDGTGNPKFCYLTTATQNIAKIYKTNYNSSEGFTNFNSISPQYAVDSAYIIITTPEQQLLNAVTQGPSNYLSYRNITTGNKVRVIDVNELYDQFAYGIKHHGLAIKKFAHFILDKWTTVAPPQAIFLIGKSIKPNHVRHDPGGWAQCLVASYGYPASDNLLLTNTNGAVWEPVIPIGRLSARNASEVNDYLHKVIEYEAAQNAVPPAEWMKEVLHFGGGDNVGQQAAIRSYLDLMKGIIQDTLYGGHVTSYFKNSPDPIIINQSDSLQAKINSGVSFMKFFGHASGSSFDIATDDPANYQNHGKYPIVSASSCFAGDMHTVQKSVGEQFVLQPDKGAIAFLASVGTGYEYYLFRYDTAQYANIAHRFYSQPFSKIIQQTCKQLQQASPTDLRIKQVVNEMTLQGDPGIRFNSWSKPDYVAEEKNISFSPANISSDMETFSMKFITRNFAKAIPDSFEVEITRTFPDGIDSVYNIKRAKCYYSDTLQLTMQLGGDRGAGVNNFKVRVDLTPDTIDELEDLANNQTTASLFIISNDITPVYPFRYAIHPNSAVTLKASTVNPFRPARPYRFEIDTTYFNDNASTHSSMYRTGVVNSAGGVVSWTPPGYTLLDSAVYYWRVFDDTATVNKKESSFIYIPQKTGWSQKHFYQFKDDKYTYSYADSSARQFKFVTNYASLHVDVYGSGGGVNTLYSLNGSVAEYDGGCGSGGGSGPAIMFAVIDSLTLQPISNLNQDHGQMNLFIPSESLAVCRSRPEGYFIYPFNDPASFTNLQDWVEDTIPNGHFLLFYSWTTYSYTNSPAALNNLMTGLGCPWPPLDSAPFIYVVKKGAPGILNYLVEGSSSSDYITLDTVLTGQWYYGNIASERIGPSTKWTSFHWNEHPLESGMTHDIASVDIMGYNQATSSWDTLIYDIPPSVPDTSLASINAAQYPYLMLNAFIKDDSLRTPPQLDRWQIYYDEVPECAINPARQFSFYNNPIAEGDTIRMSVAIDNIGNLPMDSLEVSWALYDRNHLKHTLQTYKLDSLRVGQWLTASIKVDTTFNLYGENSIWVEANPYTANHQPEQHHFNNLAEVKFKMTRDAANPILDVAFDGVHILDGDIVSGKPEIVIQLKDENRFLALNDTGNFRVYLKSPTANTASRVYFSQLSWSDSLHFIPALLPNNRCRIIYRPILSEDGIYTLEVEAADISNNLSGYNNYRITFEVINKSTITEVLNYPNPFSTSTRFVFVLTGNEVPDRMRIRIMTVSGKVVREIMKEELGNIHIGRNITDYAWDGKDEYGDRLANGVYIYKVVTDFSTGKEIEHRTSDADKYFTKGWGKMYLMR
jgi:hypothetical protein